MERYYVLEGTSPIEVLNTGNVSTRMSKSGLVTQVKIRKRNDVVDVDRDLLIIVPEHEPPPNFVRVTLSTDDDLSGFYFFVNLSAVHGMTLGQQSDYVNIKARTELVRVFLTCGLKQFTKFNRQLKTLHLHKPLELGVDNYACDHKHDTIETEEESPSTAAQILNVLTEYPENPRNSLQRLRIFLKHQKNADKQLALDTFLATEPDDVKERVHQAEITEDGRDEYLVKFAIVQYLKYARTRTTLEFEPVVTQDLWMLEWHYRNVRIALLSNN